MNNNLLKYLICYQRITGNTYWNYKTTKCSTKRNFLLLWNIIVYICIIAYSLTIHFFWIQHGNPIKGIEGDKFKMMNTILFIYYIGFTISTLVAMYTLIRYGTTMLHILDSQPILRKANKLNKLNFIVLIIILFVTQICFSILHTKFLSNKSYSTFNIFFFCFHRFLTINIHFCHLSLIGFQSINQNAIIEQIGENFSMLNDLNRIFQLLIKQRKNLLQFDKCTNIYLGISLIVHTFYSMISLYIIYFIHINEKFNMIYQFFVAITLLFLMCFYSNYVQNSCSNIIEKFQDIESPSLNTCTDHCLVNRLYSIRDDICFTTFNMYKINTKLFIAILVHIVTFGVILIQTTWIYTFKNNLIQKMPLSNVIYENKIMVILGLSD